MATVKTPVQLTDREVDAVLLKAVAKADREALESLFLRYAEHLMRYLAALGCDVDQARAICQGIFSDLWHQPKTCEAKGIIKPWLLVAAHKAWQKSLSGALPASLPERLPENVVLPRLDRALPSNSQAVSDALRRLPRDWHRILCLSELGHLSYSELGAVLDLSAETIRQKKSAARLFLFQHLPAAQDGASLPVSLSEFLDLNVYADGEMDPADSSAMARSLDDSATQQAAHDELLRLRQAMLGLAPVRVLVPPFEALEQRIVHSQQKQSGRRARIAFELFALVLALLVSAAGYLAGHSEQRDALQYALYNWGVLKAPPPLPAQRPGDVMAFMNLEGEATLTLAGGQRHGALKKSGPLHEGEKVALAENASALVILPGGSQVILRGGTEIAWQAEEDAVHARLDRGAMWCSVMPAEGRLVVESHGTALAALAGDFDVAVGPADQMMKNVLAKQSRKVISVDNAGRDAPSEQPGAPSGAVVRVTVLSGGVSAGGDAYAVMGETLFVDNANLTIIDTPIGDASADWANTVRTSPIYESVGALAFACQTLRGSLEHTNTVSLQSAIDPFKPLWPGRFAAQIAENLAEEDLQSLGGMRIVSAREVGTSVLIEVRLGETGPSSKLVMEQQDGQWRLNSQIGQLMPEIDIEDDSQGPLIQPFPEPPELPFKFV